MATASPQPKPMPGPDVPLLLSDGRVNPAWYEWLRFWFENYKIVRSEIP